mgnify:CR=1 FL=1
MTGVGARLSPNSLTFGYPILWGLKMTVIRYIDLFCGLGAFHVAFDRFNFSQGIDNVGSLSAIPAPSPKVSANCPLGAPKGAGPCGTLV